MQLLMYQEREGTSPIKMAGTQIKGQKSERVQEEVNEFALLRLLQGKLGVLVFTRNPVTQEAKAGR